MKPQCTSSMHPVLTLGRRLQLETRFLQSRYHVYVCRYEADHCASIICFPVWAAGGPQFPSSSVFCPADYENSRPGLLVCARLDGRGSTKCTVAQNAIRMESSRFYNQWRESPSAASTSSRPQSMQTASFQARLCYYCPAIENRQASALRCLLSCLPGGLLDASRA